MRIKSKTLMYMKRRYEIFRIIFLFVAAVTLVIGYLFTEENDNLARRTDTIHEAQADALKSMIISIGKDAKDEGYKNVQEMNMEIRMAYGSKDASLRSDVRKFFDGAQEETDFSRIMYKYTKLKTFNVKNNSNDPFVVTVEYILKNGKYTPILKINADYSTDCLSPYPRTMEEEGIKQFAKGIFRAAIEDAIFSGKELTVWQFSEAPKNKPWYDEIKNLDYLDVDGVINIYKKYGNDLNAISLFEFHQAIPVMEEYDIIGNPRVIGGSRLNTSAMMMFYFYNFNFKDQLTCYPEYQMKLDSYNDQIKEAVRDSLKTKRLFVFLLSINVILVVFFAGVMSTKKSELDAEEKIEEEEDVNHKQ